MSDKSKQAPAKITGQDDAERSFIDELQAAPSGEHVLYGMVKRADTSDGLMFAHPGGCERWSTFRRPRSSPSGPPLAVSCAMGIPIRVPKSNSRRRSPILKKPSPVLRICTGRTYPSSVPTCRRAGAAKILGARLVPLGSRTSGTSGAAGRSPKWAPGLTPTGRGHAARSAGKDPRVCRVVRKIVRDLRHHRGVCPTIADGRADTPRGNAAARRWSARCSAYGRHLTMTKPAAETDLASALRPGALIF